MNNIVFKKLLFVFAEIYKTIKIRIIPGIVEYLPCKLSETPPTATTNDIIIKEIVR
jgi:hypothetical protein